MPLPPVSINAALVSRLVAAQFPHWADLPVQPVEPGGWDNRTFRLGEGMTVRLPSAEAYAAQVAKEQRWLPVLASRLPLPIPVPVAQGTPGAGYPWPWSVYRWLEGEDATVERISNLSEFAVALAHFLTALQHIDAADGPPPGPHNFFRGGPLEVYDAETRQALVALKGEVDTATAASVWTAALSAPWHGPPVWFHGDVAAGNLLVENGRLCAVIDLGCAGVGDPACDLAVAWTFLSGESRAAFRTALAVSPDTWARGRGWALWKALITLAEYLDTDSSKTVEARRVIGEVLAE